MKTLNINIILYSLYKIVNYIKQSGVVCSYNNYNNELTILTELS